MLGRTASYSSMYAYGSCTFNLMVNRRCSYTIFGQSLGPIFVRGINSCMALLRPLYLLIMIFCFSSENSKFEVRAGRSLPLSIIVKMFCS